MPFFTFLISFFILSNHSLLVLLTAGASSSSSSSSMGPSPPPAPAALKPGIAAVVGILTTMFSITFLVLMYVKHCKGSMNSVSRGRGYPPSRRDSGMNRKVISSLPMFRFSSLRGQKEGLECAVCLSRFEAEEVLRLLPKCKHAFHVECVDTWLEAHSTCPLCRCRVDPEDVLLVDLATPPRARRVSGRHSSAGERGTALQIIADMGRASLDSFNYSRRKAPGARKDGLLPVKEDSHRLQHRIIISAGDGDGDGEEVRRWSDVQPADFLYLKSEMLLGLGEQGEGEGSGSAVINGRSVSEITGMSRYRGNNGGKEERERQEQGVVKRWLAWISHHNPPVQSATPPHIVL